MPRKKPEPENAPKRTTVSLPLKIYLMAEAYRARETGELLPDFSALVARALWAYAKVKHPDLLEQTVMHIRDSQPEQKKPATKPAPSFQRDPLTYAHPLQSASAPQADATKAPAKTQRRKSA